MANPFVKVVSGDISQVYADALITSVNDYRVWAGGD